MAVVFRPNDPIRPDDDLVLRAGAGDVDTLVQRAVENAADYDQLFAAEVVPSRYTISVHVPRGELVTAEEVTAQPFYLRYGAWIEAEASKLAFDFVQIVATTPVSPGEEPSALDLCHYDIAIVVQTEDDLRSRIAEVRAKFGLHRRRKN